MPGDAGGHYRNRGDPGKHFPFIRPSYVTIEFGEAFYIKELPAEDRKRAGAYSEARIREMLVKEQEERRGLRRA